jgi:hypothetical protein
MSTTPPVKYCNVHDVVSRKPFAKAHRTNPTQRKLHEMRCPATLARKLRVPCKREPQPSSHHPAQKPQQRRATSIAVIPKKVHLCTPSSPSGTFTCRRLAVLPLLLLDEYSIVGCCKRDKHWRATDGRVFTPVRNRSTHVYILPDMISTTIAKIWHNTYAG